MTAIEAFVTRHPVRTYFALAFALSWAGVLFVVGPGGIPTTFEHLMTIGPACTWRCSLALAWLAS
jgi:hypothetical protein